MSSQRNVPPTQVERRQLLQQYIDDGKTIHEISKIWNISANEICCYLRAYNLFTKNRRVNPKSVSNIPDHSVMEEQLRDLYVTQSLSTLVIGKMWKTHSNSIIFFLRAFDIPINPKGKMSYLELAEKRKQLDWLKTQLTQLYLHENKTTQEISIILQIKHSVLVKHLRDLNISTRNDGKRFVNHLQTMPSDKHILKAELEKLYVEEQNSLSEIAKIWGVDLSTVSKSLKRVGIKSRAIGRTSSIQTQLLKKGILTKDDDLEPQLRTLYVEQNLSVQEIADRWGVSNTTILNYLKMCGIPKYNVGRKSVPTIPKKSYFLQMSESDPTSLKKQLEKMYVEDKTSMSDIALSFDVSTPTVKKYLQNFELIKPDAKMTYLRNKELMRETLEKLYVEQKLTPKQIASEMQLSIVTIRKYLSEFDIQQKQNP